MTWRAIGAASRSRPSAVSRSIVGDSVPAMPRAEGPSRRAPIHRAFTSCSHAKQRQREAPSTAVGSAARQAERGRSLRVKTPAAPRCFSRSDARTHTGGAESTSIALGSAITTSDSVLPDRATSARSTLFPWLANAPLPPACARSARYLAWRSTPHARGLLCSSGIDGSVSNAASSAIGSTV